MNDPRYPIGKFERREQLTAGERRAMISAPAPTKEGVTVPGKVVINLASGLDDAERVTVAFLARERRSTRVTRSRRS